MSTALNISRSWPLVCDQRSQNWTSGHRPNFRGVEGFRGFLTGSNAWKSYKIMCFFMKRTSTLTCWEVILVWNPGTTKLKLYGFQGPGTPNNQPSIGTWNNHPLVQGTYSWNLKLSLFLFRTTNLKPEKTVMLPCRHGILHWIPWNLHLLKGDQPKGIYQNELSFQITLEIACLKEKWSMDLRMPTFEIH